MRVFGAGVRAGVGMVRVRVSGAGVGAGVRCGCSVQFNHVDQPPVLRLGLQTAFHYLHAEIVVKVACGAANQCIIRVRRQSVCGSAVRQQNTSPSRGTVG